MLSVCDAAAAKIGPPVRGAEPMWSVVEALRAATGRSFARGMAAEGFLFSRVRVVTVAISWYCVYGVACEEGSISWSGIKA